MTPPPPPARPWAEPCPAPLTPHSLTPAGPGPGRAAQRIRGAGGACLLPPGGQRCFSTLSPWEAECPHLRCPSCVPEFLSTCWVQPQVEGKQEQGSQVAVLWERGRLLPGP